MKRSETYELVLAGSFTAIILLMAVVPQLGFVTILPGVSITLVHVPTLIGIFLLSRKYALMLGLFFGIGSWIASLLYAANPFDFAFQYPWISILPRILFALAAFYIFKGLKALESRFKQGRVMIFTVVSLVTIFSLYYGLRAVSNNTGWDFSVIAPVALFLSALFLSAYFYFLTHNKGEEAIYPSSFILGTVAHTVIVLSTVALFAPNAFFETFGQDESVLALIYTIAISNGLIEALVAVLIGMPIIYAIRSMRQQA
ncbi:MAG: hypothetical protein ACLFTZ_03850 [Acholeplasmataceae bacterium]